MDPEQGPEPGKPRPLLRWVIVPLAFSWIGLMLTAPFVLVSELVVAAGCTAGALVGLLVSWRNPRWIRTVERTEQPMTRTRPPATPSHRALLTILAVGFASIVLFGAFQGLSDKGPFFFMALFLMISFSRRALRKAWGMPGSFAGMLVSGALLVLVIKSAFVKQGDELGLIIAVAVPLVVLEAVDELRALQRTNAATPN